MRSDNNEPEKNKTPHEKQHNSHQHEKTHKPQPQKGKKEKSVEKQEDSGHNHGVDQVPSEESAPTHKSHHGHMMEDYKKRFWVSVILTFPVFLLSPMIQEAIGIWDFISFPGDQYVFSF
ncbi:MAG: hypothetical protein KUA33_03450 [Methanobacterium sp.]|nr:hypothetical protein [Methanobacterium sp.]MBV1767310.1 hypothetical protein [Methanobacterium sp.]